MHVGGVFGIGTCPRSTAGLSSGEKAFPYFQPKSFVFQLGALCSRRCAMLTVPLVLLIRVAAQARVWPWLSSPPTSTQGCPLELLPQAARCLIKMVDIGKILEQTLEELQSLPAYRQSMNH